MTKRILIIEDDPDILEILNIIFQDEGYDIVSKRNGMSADEIGLLHPDIVLLDVRISGCEKTGAQICAELKAFTVTSHLPVLLLSAEKNLAMIASSCGANGYLTKPFDIMGLTEKVREMIKY
ncbi:response regulator [Pedobacter frigiditerrae]|uniref:Response regulator n=1 Tax=Pedobacter frigiditerrae TaxID=2530452 RepID=A0A4V2MJ24_9SPHI|nr:response regulator [Pedobacter frigiditerrae]TCC92396.1 response regulator [Pedobacter frigiditerrae]